MSPKNILALVLLSCAVITLLAVLGFPPGHSARFNFGWSTQYTEAFSWTNPLPRYLPGLWAGFGGYDFFFYAPLPFWFGAAFIDPLCPGCLTSTEFVLSASVALVASGFTMFQFLRCNFSIRPAAFGAIIYVILPYHLLIDWFERQAVGEFTAYAFIPLVALGTESIRRNVGGGWILAVGVAGTALSHLPTALLAAHVFAILFILFAFLEHDDLFSRIRLFARFAWFGGLGLALASFYWFPAIVLLDSVSPEVLFDKHYEAWRWLYGQATAQPSLVFANRVLVSFLACVPLILASLRCARGPIIVWILVPVVFAVFMNSALSEPIWREWIISRVQFPWRLMTLVDFAASIAAAVLAAKAIDRGSVFRLLTVMAFTLVPATYLAITVRFTQSDVAAEQRYHDWFAAKEYMSPEMTVVLRNRIIQGEAVNIDRYAIASAIQKMESEFHGALNRGELLNRGPRSLTAIAAPGASVLSLPVQYWYLWKAETVSGKTLEIRANQKFGTLDVVAPEGGFQEEPVVVWLPLHTSELIGIVASFLALLFLIASSFKNRRGKS